MNRVELKTKAKESLKNKYGDAITFMLLEYLINFGVQTISSMVLFIIQVIYNLYIGTSFNSISILFYIILMIVNTIVISLIGFGKTSYYLKISRNDEVNYKELFNKFELCIPYILIYLITGLFVFMWSILFIIPGIIASFSYTLVYYIKLDNPNMNTFEVINKSKQMMKGYKLDYFILELSFIGWEILGIFTFGLLHFWLTPYKKVTLANFYNYLNENTN